MAADSFPGASSPVRIAERALRRCRALSAYERAAPTDLTTQIALEELASIIASVCGNRTCWWLVGETLWFTLTADTWEYDLSTALGASWPEDGVQWVLQAMTRSVGSTTTADEVDIVRRDEIEEASPAGSGTPTRIYIDRSTNKQLRLDRAPAAGTPGVELGLVVQRYAPDATAKHPEVATGFAPAWDEWLVTKLAISLGSGTITSVEMERLRDWRDEADTLWADLMGGTAQQRVSTPPICDAYPF